MCSFKIIFIYVNVSVFVYKFFSVNCLMGKASPQISENSTLRIIFPDYMHFTILFYVRRYFEAAITGILILFKVFSNYKKQTTTPTFSGYCFVKEKL